MARTKYTASAQQSAMRSTYPLVSRYAWDLFDFLGPYWVPIYISGSLFFIVLAKLLAFEWFDSPKQQNNALGVLGASWVH